MECPCRKGKALIKKKIKWIKGEFGWAFHFLNNIHFNAAFLYTECISAFLSKEKYYIKNIGEKEGLFLSLVKYRL